MNSTRNRDAGNAYFKRKKWNSALKLYNEALMVAPFHFPLKQDLAEDDTSYLLALGNRSAVYFELGDEASLLRCVKDIDAILSFNSVASLLWKLRIRKLSALIRLNALNQAQEWLDACYKERMTSPVPADCELKLETVVAEYTKARKATNIEWFNGSVKKSDYVPSAIFNASSNLVNLKFDPEKNSRGVFATTDIKEGDILFSETAFASIVIPDYAKLLCHVCHRLLEGGQFYP